MWFKLFDYIQNNKDLRGKNLVLYSHNLGSFDAYFIYKPLVKYFKGKSNNKLNPISAFIDDRNKFIMINAQYSHNTLEGKYEEELASKGYSEEQLLKKLIKWDVENS